MQQLFNVLIILIIFHRPPKDVYYDYEAEEKDLKTEEDTAKKQNRQGCYTFYILKKSVIYIIF